MHYHQTQQEITSTFNKNGIKNINIARRCGGLTRDVIDKNSAKVILSDIAGRINSHGIIILTGHRSPWITKEQLVNYGFKVINNVIPASESGSFTTKIFFIAVKL